MEKPSVEATKHIRPLYIRAHLNSKPFSRVLIDNRSAVNIMPSRLLHSLGKIAEELIVTDIAVAAFTEEVTKIIGVLPAEITVGSKKSLNIFFVMDSTASYNLLLERDWIHAN